MLKPVSQRLAAAYGFAVTGTMTFTGAMMAWIFYLQGKLMMALRTLSHRIPSGSCFSLIKRLSPAFVQFYKLPANKLHRVVTRIEM
jgi:K+ transporter